MFPPPSLSSLSLLSLQDLFDCIKALLEEHRLDPKKIVGFTADGASVMGTMRSLSDQGSNVAYLLSQLVGKPLLVTHCAAHRLQLAISGAYTKVPYLKDMEKRINSPPGQPVRSKGII